MTFKLPLYPNSTSTSGAMGSSERGSCVVRAQRQDTSCHHSPVEIHTLLGELPVAVVRVLEGLILDDFYTFPSVTLLMAVLADHVQLSDFVLQNTETEVSPTRPLKTFPLPHETTNSTFCSGKRADTWVWCSFSWGARRASGEQKAETTCSCEHSASRWQSPWGWQPNKPRVAARRRGHGNLPSHRALQG